jgi:phosphoribosylformimino-5-aminoimidazole carboxamide ribonucleotide (ProFAR) isomerase
MKPTFTLIAGVEISSGQVANLTRGAIDPSHRFGDPVAAAQHWVNNGAEWIHLADLDAAAGTGSNHGAVAAVVQAMRGRARVQLAGGIQDAASLAEALALEPARVILDTAALADMAWVTSVMGEHADIVAADLAVDGMALYAPGSAVHGNALDDALLALETAGCHTFVVTDVDAEGSRKGSNRHALKLVCELERHHVIAGGGIAHLGDLHHLFEMVPAGLEAAIIDRALYEEAFTFPEAIAAAEPHFDMFVWGPPGS